MGAQNVKNVKVNVQLGFAGLLPWQRRWWLRPSSSTSSTSSWSSFKPGKNKKDLGLFSGFFDCLSLLAAPSAVQGQYCKSQIEPDPINKSPTQNFTQCWNWPIKLVTWPIRASLMEQFQHRVKFYAEISLLDQPLVSLRIFWAKETLPQRSALNELVLKIYF